MLKIKSWIFTPQVIICYILLVGILISTLSAKPELHMEEDQIGPYDTHTLTWQDMKSYQLQITLDGKYVIMYDYDRVVGVLPLDNECNLTKLIEMDND